MNDELNTGTDFSSLEDILSEIDTIRKNRAEATEDELVSSSARTRHYSDGGDDETEADAPAEEVSVPEAEDDVRIAEDTNVSEPAEDKEALDTHSDFDLDELFDGSGKASEKSVISGDTQVIDAPVGHELFFSLGHQPSDADRHSFDTEEYEPEEYGLSDDGSLSFISRGMRQARSVNSSDREETHSGKTFEYVSPSQRHEVAMRLRSLLRGDVLRAVFTAPFALVLLYIGLSGTVSLPMPAFMGDPLIYGLTALAALLTVIGINCIPLAKAVKDTFTARTNPDAPLPFAALASAALLIYDLAAPSADGAFPLLAASFALAAVTAAVWRGVRTSAVLRTFSIVGSNRQKGVLVPIDDERTSLAVMGRMLSGGVTVFKPERTDFVSDFIRNSSAPDVSAHASLIMTFISLPMAILAAVLSYMLGSGVRDAVCSACAILFAFTPLTSRLVFAIPFSRAAKRTTAYSSAVIGYKAAESMNNVGAVVIDSNHLFPKGSISLDAMRTFGTLRIDDAIADAASVVCAAGGALSRIFLGVIDNDRSLLRKVDSLLYEDGLGLSAWVNDRRVLVGTAELLRGHGVSVPSRDYEARYSSSGQNLVYVSVGGVLTAMFVVSYHARQEIYDVLFELRKMKIGLVIVNRDCNITSQMITKLFDFPSKLINIMTPTNEHLLGESMEKVCPAGIVYSKGLMGIGRTVISSLRLVSAVSLANVVQIGGILLTAALTVYLSAVGSIGQFTLTELLTCQLVWGVITTAAARFRKS